MWLPALASQKIETSVAQTTAHAEKKVYRSYICMQRLPQSWLLQQLGKYR